jgi:hypothetical protein
LCNLILKEFLKVHFFTFYGVENEAKVVVVREKKTLKQCCD